ncbi:MAG: hypothetical protein AAF763_17060 [Pseudomonadota bacterium]
MSASKTLSKAAGAAALCLLAACSTPGGPGSGGPQAGANARYVVVDHWAFEVTWEGRTAQAVATQLPDWDNDSLTRMASLRAMERATFCTPRRHAFDAESQTTQAVLNCAIAPLL